MTSRRKNLWGWLILVAMGALLNIFGHYSFSVHDHNLFMITLLFLSMGVVGLFTVLYSQKNEKEKPQ